MKPGNLLLADLTRAHRTFLLHHDTCLDALLERSGRPRFAAVLARYWDLFLSTWSVLLHGNPARDVHPGIVVAASGELGVGVGEEERGSGERDVLEGLVDGVYGLVDLVVARYGDEHGDEQGEEGPWLGAGREPGPEDGAVFLGTGALSRRSLRDVTAWMGDLYTWGEHAYGVIDSPSSVRRRRGKKGRRHREHKGASTEAGAAGTKPAGEDVTKPTQDVGGAAAEAAETEVPAAETAAPAEAPATETTAPTAPAPEAPAEAAAPEASASAHAEAPDAPDAPGKLGKMVSYLKMGYGTYWTLPVRTETTDTPPPPATTQRPESEGYFLIGLKGDIYEDAGASDASDSSDNSRTMLRTLTVDLAGPANNEELSSSTDGTASTRLRVVVYACRPFLFTLLFQTHTDSLALDSSYRSLHQRLSPLRRPLLSSTRYRPDRPQQPQSSTGLLGGNSSAAAAAIYDLVWDPTQLTVHSTMPSIPETHDPSATEPWSRADALNTHTHILAVHASTNSTSGHALERSQKTSRGWWIVWTRLLRHHAPVSPPANLSTIQESVSEDEREASDAEEEGAEEEGPPPTVDKDIYLVRRASDHVRARDAAASGRLASGIGVDTRRYVEDLLSLL